MSTVLAGRRHDVAPGGNEDAEANIVEYFFEQHLIFKSRWLLAPVYGILIVTLVLLLLMACSHLYDMIVPLTMTALTITGILEIVEIALVMNLILMILFVGYSNFVSHIRFDKKDAPQWLRGLRYGELKVQLIGSMIAISGIILLKQFVAIMGSKSGDIDLTKTILLVVIHITFLLSGTILAIINKISDHASSGSNPSTTKVQDQLLG